MGWSFAQGTQSTIKIFSRWEISALAGSFRFNYYHQISGVTFIGVPGMIYAAGGDFTYLQWGIGSILARIIVNIYFVAFLKGNLQPL